MTNYSLAKITIFLIITIFSVSLSFSDNQSPNKVIGTHIFEGANGFAVFSETHLLWILNNKPSKNEPSDLLASLESEAVGGTYQFTGKNSMSLTISHAIDSDMIGQVWQYEIQWLENDRIRFWVLTPEGNRSQRTGVVTKIN